MATTDRPTPTDADPVAAARELQTAAFVGIAGVATGDGLAATAQLAGALSARSIPFQVRLRPLGASGRLPSGDDCTVAIGRPTVEASVRIAAPGSLSAPAYEIAAELGEPDPALALAGHLVADATDESAPEDIVAAAGIDREPGLGIPTSNPRDDLAWSTLLHAPFSGDPEALAERLDAIDHEAADADRRRASLVAMTVAGDGGPAGAAAAVSRVLRPFHGGPFETIPGYADVVSALAVEAPGLGLQVVLSGRGQDRALERWRAHGRRVHDAVRTADRTTADDLLVASVGAAVPLRPVARLLRDYVATNPVVAVASDDAVLATTRDAPDHLASAVETARSSVEDESPGSVRRTGTEGRYARLMTDAPEAVTTALAEAL